MFWSLRADGYDDPFLYRRILMYLFAPKYNSGSWSCLSEMWMCEQDNRLIESDICCHLRPLVEHDAR